jgi:hypothetical protein
MMHGQKNIKLFYNTQIAGIFLPYFLNIIFLACSHVNPIQVRFGYNLSLCFQIYMLLFLFEKCLCLILIPFP